MFAVKRVRLSNINSSVFRRCMSSHHPFGWHTNDADNTLKATTICCVRKDGKTCLIGDGQVTTGSVILKNTIKKVYGLLYCSYLPLM